MIRRHGTYKAVQTIRFTWMVVGTFAALAAFATDASAALIFNSVRFDAKVRSGGTTGTEQHFTNDDFPPTNGIPGGNYHSFPSINPNLPGSLIDTPTLRIQLVENQNAPLGPDTYDRSTVWITAATGKIIENPLDNTVPYPIEWETNLYLSDLPDGQKLIFAGIRYEEPVPAGIPSVVEVSDNRGSMSDPINVLLKFDGNDLPNSPSVLKVHFYWDTMEMTTIPEPSTGLMLLLGAVGSLAVSRRRCQ